MKDILLKKDAIQVHELKQLPHFLALLEGIIVLSMQNLLCDEEIMLEFHREKSKLTRHFNHGSPWGC
jgi:hypothetical protein